MRLQPGSTIALVSTARFIDVEALAFAKNKISAWGYITFEAANITKAVNQFAGTDDDRNKAFQDALDNPAVDAIWFVRGGYGSLRSFEAIDFTHFAKNPKLLIGYSDITVWHSVLNKIGITTLHATMPISFKTNTLACLQETKNVLAGEKYTYTAPAHPLNIKGMVKAKVLGGNLSMLYSLTGTEVLPSYEGAILFLEDLDEYLYHIDRMMQNLKYSGILSKIKGVVIGGMSDMKDNTIPFGKTAEEIIAETIRPYNIPLAFNFSIGHINENMPLLLGAEHSLEIREDGVASLQLLEGLK